VLGVSARNLRSLSLIQHEALDASLVALVAVAHLICGWLCSLIYLIKYGLVLALALLGKYETCQGIRAVAKAQAKGIAKSWCAPLGYEDLSPDSVKCVCLCIRGKEPVTELPSEVHKKPP
jgi:hypothetical protein